MTAKPGGDQILLRNSRTAPGASRSPSRLPAAILPARRRDRRQGRPWVFWSANENGQFRHLWARSWKTASPAPPCGSPREAGSDIDPAAATDSSGRVWVAWQGWRNGTRLHLRRDAERRRLLQARTAVAPLTGNEWNPAIAADANGRVTVAWDSYRNGNYDIFAAHRDRSGAWGKEMPVAATATLRSLSFASPTIPPARSGWPTKRAAKAGARISAPTNDGHRPLPGPRRAPARLRAATARGRAGSDPGAVLPGAAHVDHDETQPQNDSDDWLKPDPERLDERGREPSAPPNLLRARATPRRACKVDSSGRLWLACRSSHPIFWNRIGTVWTEYVIVLRRQPVDARPIYLHHTDNLLDNRPALVSAQPGELMVIGSSDGRRASSPCSYMPGIATSAPTRKRPTIPTTTICT